MKRTKDLSITSGRIPSIIWKYLRKCFWKSSSENYYVKAWGTEMHYSLYLARYLILSENTVWKIKILLSVTSIASSVHLPI